MFKNNPETGSVRKRGNKLGFWFFKTALKLFGLAGAYGLLYFVCLYYLIIDQAAVRPCMAYMKRRFPGAGFVRRVFGVYRIFINQGKALIDRHYSISGLGSFDTKLIGYDRIKGILEDSDKGFVLLTAHVGNWQVALTVLEKLGRTVHLLMRPEENPAVKESLNVSAESARVRVISPDGFLGGMVESANAINKGEIVSIMGDRSYGSNSVEADFLGGPVQFPHGAFSIAASVGCPVVVLLPAKVSRTKYIVDVSNIIEPRYTSRERKSEEIRKWVQEFAHAMEGYVSEYPYQWFVFHDIWKNERHTGLEILKTIKI